LAEKQPNSILGIKNPSAAGRQKDFPSSLEDVPITHSFAVQVFWKGYGGFTTRRLLVLALA
jgi:hypothetical protein